MSDSQVKLSLDNTSYTKEKLEKGIQVKYSITGSLESGAYFITFAPEGQAIIPSTEIPFSHTAGSGYISLAPDAPGWLSVPWSKWPPKDICYKWDIVLAKKADGSFIDLARISMDILEAPEITKVTYGEGKLYVEWIPHGGSSFDVVLTKVGSDRQDYCCDTNYITIEKELMCPGQYKVSVFAFDQSQYGPSSIEYDIIIDSPDLTGLDCTKNDNRYTVDVSWGEKTDATQYHAIMETTDGTVIDNATVSGNTCQFIETLDTENTYQVSVMSQSNGGIVTGPKSTPLMLITRTPVLNSVVYSLYEGEGIVHAVWNKIDMAAQYTVTVYKADGSEAGSTTVSDNTCNFKLTLDPNESYNLQVRAESSGGKVKGPGSDAVSIIVKTPEISLLKCSLSNAGKVLDINWNGVPGAENYTVTVNTDQSQQNYETDVLSFRIDNIDDSKNYSIFVTPYRQDGRIIGPSGAALKPILASPEFTQVKYSFTQSSSGVLDLSWSSIGENYTAALSEKNGAKVTQTVSTNSCRFTDTLSPLKTYNVTVRAESSSGIIVGPDSDPVEPITDTTGISGLQYSVEDNGGNLAVNWNGVEGIDGYIAIVKAGETEVARKSTNNTSCTFNQSLNPSNVYVVQVMLTRSNGVIIGPGSPDLEAMVIMPSFNQIQYTLVNGKGTLLTAWDRISGAGIYDAVLSTSEGTLDTKTVTGSNCQFAVTLDKTKTYYIKARSKSSDGIVCGPYNNPQLELNIKIP